MFPLRKIVPHAEQVLLVHLAGRRKEIAMCGSQRCMDGRVEPCCIVRKCLMQKTENTCLKRQTPCAPGNDAKAPKQLIVPVQGSRNTPHRCGVSLRRKKESPPVFLKQCFGLIVHGAVFFYPVLLSCTSGFCWWGGREWYAPASLVQAGE